MSPEVKWFIIVLGAGLFASIANAVRRRQLKNPPKRAKLATILTVIFLGGCVIVLAHQFLSGPAPYATLVMENDIEGLTGRTRSEFVESAAATCVKSQNNHPENKDISASIISQYCNCYASGMADRVSPNEMRSLGIGKKDQSTWLAIMQPKIDAAADACISRLANH
jgi:hypothetical protein